MEHARYTKGERVFIIADDVCPEPPTSIAHIMHWHRSYNLGKRIDRDDVRHYEKSKDWGVLMPLYMYDHGSRTLSLEPFTEPFDSGQVGIVGITSEDFRKEFEDDPQKATEYVQGWLRELSCYLNGEVYYWMLKKITRCGECDHITSEDIFDDCGGYYGTESFEQMKEEAGVDETWTCEEETQVV